MATVAKDTTPLPSMPEPPAEVVQAPQRALPTVPKTAPVPPKAPIAKVDLPSIPEDVIEEEDPAVLKSQMKAMENKPAETTNVLCIFMVVVVVLTIFLA